MRYVVALALIAMINLAQAFTPSSTTLVVPYPPGGTVDLVARLVAQSARSQGHNWIVENRAGAEGRIPYAQFARVRNQPNMLLMGASGPMYFGPLLADNDSGYNTQTSFRPVVHMGKAYHFILVHPSTQVRDLKQLTKSIKTSRDPLNFASGNATSRFMLEYLFAQTGVRGQIVPYNGGGPAFVAMMSGYVPFGAETTPSASVHIKSGKLRPIAITSLTRIAQAPTVATVNETLRNNFEVFSTYALLGTQDMPAEAVAYYNNLVNQLLRDRFLAEKFPEFHIEITGGSAQYLADDIKTQTERWSRIAKQVGK